MDTSPLNISGTGLICVPHNQNQCEKSNFSQAGLCNYLRDVNTAETIQNYKLCNRRYI